MNVLYLRTERGERCTSEEKVDEAIDYLLNLYSENYATLLSQMLRKAAHHLPCHRFEGRARNVTSGAFIKKYRLLSSSSVMSAVKKAFA